MFAFFLLFWASVLITNTGGITTRTSNVADNFITAGAAATVITSKPNKIVFKDVNRSTIHQYLRLLNSRLVKYLNLRNLLFIIKLPHP